jgi:hypothetical protein
MTARLESNLTQEPSNGHKKKGTTDLPRTVSCKKNTNPSLTGVIIPFLMKERAVQVDSITPRHLVDQALSKTYPPTSPPIID